MADLPWVECPTHEVNYGLKPAQRYAQTPEPILELGRTLLRSILDEIPAGAHYIADLVRIRTASRFHGEITSLAELIGASWRDLMLANVSYDLTLATFGCSTVALATSDGPVVARNMDWWPEKVLARSSCLIQYFEDGGLRFANAGWPGAVGVVTGLSSRGFAVVLNAALSEESMNAAGYPVLLHLRRVLEDAPDFDAALQMLAKTKLTTSALITVVGRQNNQRVVVERSPTKHAFRWPGSELEPLIATNDYRTLFEPKTHGSSEIYRTTCQRYDFLTRFFADHNQSESVDSSKLLYALTDNSVIQTITAQHILIWPASNTIRMFVPRRLVEDSNRQA